MSGAEPQPMGRPKRGDLVGTEGGGVGRYVGRLPAGSDWVCYEPAEYAKMCAAFDGLRGRYIW